MAGNFVITDYGHLTFHDFVTVVEVDFNFPVLLIFGKGIAMHTDSVGGGQFSPYLEFIEEDAVVSGLGGFVFLLKGVRVCGVIVAERD